MSIKIENLNHIYNEGTPFQKQGLKNINLHIKPNELIGIIGTTGSGKSTLVQHLNGLLKATNSEASIIINGKDLYKDKNNLRNIRKEVGIVFQYPEYQLFETTVLEDVCFGPKNMGLSEEEAKENAYYALKMFDLPEDIYEKSPFELSGGQKRKVAIAGVLAMKPKILILDEPTAGLDPKSRNELFGQINNMRQQDMTIIIISHSMEDISVLADKVLIMSGGELVKYDKTSNIFAEPEVLLSAGLDIPEMSKLTMKLQENGIDISSGIYSEKQVVEEIYKFIKGDGYGV